VFHCSCRKVCNGALPQYIHLTDRPRVPLRGHVLVHYSPGGACRQERIHTSIITCYSKSPISSRYNPRINANFTPLELTWSMPPAEYRKLRNHRTILRIQVFSQYPTMSSERISVGFVLVDIQQLPLTLTVRFLSLISCLYLGSGVSCRECVDLVN
jgi:hypothetical protein